MLTVLPALCITTVALATSCVFGGAQTPPPAAAPAAVQPTSPEVLATVNGAMITRAELEAYVQARTELATAQLPRTEILDALINDHLLIAATASKPHAPGTVLSTEDRTAREAQAYTTLDAATLPAPSQLQVMHAWVKDAAKKKQQAQQRARMEKLRTLVEPGQAFVAASGTIPGDAAAWHVADAEVYPLGVLPAAVRTLAPGSLSAILPGDGGIHLFRVLAQVYEGEAEQARRDVLYKSLRAAATIELLRGP